MGGVLEILHATMCETHPTNALALPWGWKFFGKVKRRVEVFAFSCLYLTEWKKWIVYKKYI